MFWINFIITVIEVFKFWCHEYSVGFKRNTIQISLKQKKEFTEHNRKGVKTLEPGMGIELWLFLYLFLQSFPHEISLFIIHLIQEARILVPSSSNLTSSLISTATPHPGQLLFEKTFRNSSLIITLPAMVPLLIPWKNFSGQRLRH